MNSRNLAVAAVVAAVVLFNRLGAGENAPHRGEGEPGGPPGAAPSGSAPVPPVPSSAAAVVQQSLQAEAETAKAAAEAHTAGNVEEAKKAVAKAEENKRAAISSVEPDKPATVLAAANATTNAADATKSLRDKASSTMCGLDDDNDARWWCFTYGLFGATLSQVNVHNNDVVGGQTTHRLAAIAVPAASLRLVPRPNHWGFVAIDVVTLYSAFLSQDLSVTSPDTSKQSCSQNGGDFERRLPCEANAVLHPYIGLNLGGITFGKGGLGYASIVPFTYGLAQAGSDAHLRKYWGWWSFGAIQINGTL